MSNANSNSSSNKNVIPQPNINNNIVIKRNNSSITEQSKFPSQNYNIKHNLYSNMNNVKRSENERKQIADFLINKKSDKSESSHAVSAKNMTNQSTNKNLELQKIINQGRENLKKQGKGEDVVWSNENRYKNLNSEELNLPKNNFPKIIFVDKQKNKNLSEEQYNQNRYLNNLDKIVNEDKEDSDNQSNEEDLHSKEPVTPKNPVSSLKTPETPSTYEREEPDLSNVETEVKPPQNLEAMNLVSDYSEMEEMKIELENFLGLELFKTLYHYVESTTDPKEFKFNNENLILKIQNELTKQYSAEDIEKALSKSQEVFALVVKERMANLAN